MYIINITYKVSLDTVDNYLQPHITFLDEQYALGNFHASGRKVPRDGGIILSLMSDKEQLLKILEQDPFKKHALATYEVIEFIPSKTSKEMSFLLE